MAHVMASMQMPEIASPLKIVDCSRISVGLIYLGWLDEPFFLSEGDRVLRAGDKEIKRASEFAPHERA